MSEFTKTMPEVIEKFRQKHGISHLGVLHLDEQAIHDLPKVVKEKFPDPATDFLPEYIKKTLDKRIDPRKLFPWAKSVFLFAIPFSRLPVLPQPLPSSNDAVLSGKIAGYATRQDYHIFGKNLIGSFMEECAEEAGNFQYEICIDTKPVAERALGVEAGIGLIGRNFSLLTVNNGSGCFLAEAFSELDIPNISPEHFPLPCPSCNLCSASCRTGALASAETFGYANCRSYLTMEKRGMLTPEEENSLEDWIFGCDDCTCCCPGSNLPAAAQVDLKWLLLSPSSVVKKQIAGMALEYAGVSLLRRNALAVLANKNAGPAFDLIKEFAGKTESRLLREMAENLLKRQ